MKSKLSVRLAHMTNNRTSFIITCLAVILCAGSATTAAHAQSVTENVVYSFCSLQNCGDGFNADGTLTLASDGNYYGTTYENSGDNFSIIQDGTFFKVTPDGILTTLHNFCSKQNCTDGVGPDSGAIQGSDGNFYGTAPFGGANGIADGGYGVVFKITPAGEFTTLYSFCSQANCADGETPVNTLVEGSDGEFYGNTSYGGVSGSNSYGTIFKITSSGSLTVLHKFTGGSDGGIPYGSLLQGSDGNFYGVTATGGLGVNTAEQKPGYGTIFKITPSGTLTTLYSFMNGNDSQGPDSGLMQGSDGNFYGTTGSISGGNNGTVFKMTPSGELTTLAEFATAPPYGSAYSILAPAGDGNFYGTAPNSGTSDDGSIFKVTPEGVITTLYSFCAAAKCADGAISQSGVSPSSSGSLLGLAESGGAHGGGALYNLTFTDPLPAPIQLTLSQSSVKPKTAVTLSWKVLNALATTTQQCYANVQNAASGAGTWTGKQIGKLSGATYSGSTTITPTANGSYTYALTCAGTISGFATLTVATPKSNSTTILSATPNPASVGQVVTLKATVAGSAAAPTGSVTFYYGSFSLGTAVLSAGIATKTASTNGLPPGTYSLTAKYSGDTTYNASTSAAYGVTLAASATSTTLTAAPTTVTPPASVILTATVVRTASGSTGYPGGKVTFYYQSTALGTANLSANGVATFSASSAGIPAGNYAITAKYSGDGGDLSSQSSSVTVTVK